METRTVLCPYCQSSLDTPTSLEGQEAQCPICKKNFIVRWQKPDVQQDENQVNVPAHNKKTHPRGKRHLIVLLMGCGLFLLLTMNVLLCVSLVIQQSNMKELETRIYGIQNEIDNGFESTGKAIELSRQKIQTTIDGGVTNIREGQKEMATKIVALADNTAYKPVIGYKIVSYTWESFASMEYEIKQVLSDGYEPAGYLCQNSLRGGIFLFVKRQK